MTNESLADDYLKRAKGRVRAVEVLMEDELFADVVREAQKACELALKAVIRKAGHSVPHTHEVSGKLREIKEDLPSHICQKLDRLSQISKSMRRDQELSFYGGEDITPSEFYKRSHAEKALAELKVVLSIVG